MVALLKTKPREHRHYPMGPLEHDIPLRVYNENAADLRDNLNRPVPWWVELAMAAGFVFVILVPAVAAVVLAFGAWQ